jgi:hypothetical protein
MNTSSVTPELRHVDRRPFGLYAIIALLLIWAVAAGLTILDLRGQLPQPTWQDIARLLTQQVSLTGLVDTLINEQRLQLVGHILVILAVVTVIVGLWLRVRQAWVMAMLLVGLGLVYNIWHYLDGTPLYVSMLIHVVAVFYLNDRGVRLYFAQAEPGPGGGL